MLQSTTHVDFAPFFLLWQKQMHVLTLRKPQLSVWMQEVVDRSHQRYPSKRTRFSLNCWSQMTWLQEMPYNLFARARDQKWVPERAAERRTWWKRKEHVGTRRECSKVSQG